jgi:hypothetical protein
MCPLFSLELSMSATPVSICSNALLMLGDRPIADFNEGTDRATIAANTWESSRDFVLRRHPWNCAVKRVILSPDVTGPAFDYAYQFQLPSDFLRLLSIGEEGTRTRYRLESRKVLMDENACRLRYIWRNDNPATWDAMLIEAMTRVMRAVFSYAITQSGNLEQLMMQELQPILREARAVDGTEDEPEALDESPLMAARFIGGGRYNRYRGA